MSGGMTEQDILREARMIALERMVCHTYNMTIKILQMATGITDDVVAESEAASLEGLRMMPVAKVDAALSDVLSDEIVQDLSRLLEMARDLRKIARGSDEAI